MSIDELRTQALLLSAEERELLAVELFGSLASSDMQTEVDEEWAAEILARSDALRAGHAAATDADESLARVRARLATGTPS